MILVAGAAPAPSQAAEGDIGYEGPSFSGASGDPTAEKVESKLWWNDGFWWGSMFDPASTDFHIFKLDPATQRWTDTGVAIDPRHNSRADTLWDGTHLYVASHVYTTSPASGTPSYLYRFSYNAATDTYSRDSGYPVSINNYKTETLVIDKDSTGKLWATWVQGLKVYVNRTVGDDRNWGTPFALPVSGVTVAKDDVSSLVSFGGKIGVMWSNQVESAMYFAIHVDGQSDTSWQPTSVAYGGSKNADDHLNLKQLQEDGGRVYAVIKTSQTSASAPLIVMLVYKAGSWTSAVYGRVADSHTRPILLLDTGARRAYVFATGPHPPSTNGQSGGDIYMKSTSLDNPSFSTGRGTPVIRDADSDDMNDATSTKQNVSTATGLVVLAGNRTMQRYWHHYDSLGGAPPPNTAPTASNVASSTAAGTPVSITLTGSDAETCELAFVIDSPPTNGSLGALSGAACSPGSPNSDRASVTYTPNAGFSGSDSFTYHVNDGSLSSSVATVTVTVTSGASNTAPTASNVASSTAAGTPVSITLTGSDAETCELAFVIDSPPTNGSLGALSGAACSPGSPNSDRASVTYTPNAGFSGSDSFTYHANDGSLSSSVATVTVTVSPGGGGGTISSRSASSAANAVATTLEIAAPAGVAANDVLVAAIDVRSAPVITAPAGWTLIRSDTNGTNMTKASYVHVASGSEPSSYTWTFSASKAAAGGIVAYSGVNTASPIDAHSGSVASSTSQITGPSVTTTVPNTMLVMLAGMIGAGSVTPPGGMAEQWDIPSSAGTYKVTSEGSNALAPSAGATGDRVATSSSTNPNVGQLIALRPAP